jgi:Domain of unknown function (DUF4386)
VLRWIFYELLKPVSGNVALFAAFLQAHVRVRYRLSEFRFSLPSSRLSYFQIAFFPRILGIGVAAGGIDYVANILATAFPPDIGAHLFPYIMLPAGVAEISLTPWLINPRRERVLDSHYSEGRDEI